MVKRRKHAECESFKWDVIVAKEEVQREILTHLLAGKVELDNFASVDDGIYIITIFTSTGKQFAWQVRPRTNTLVTEVEKTGSCYGEFYPMDGHTRYDLYGIIPELLSRMNEIAMPVYNSYKKNQAIGDAFKIVENLEASRLERIIENQIPLPEKKEAVNPQLKSNQAKEIVRLKKEMFMWKYYCILFLISTLGLVLFLFLNIDKLSAV